MKGIGNIGSSFHLRSFTFFALSFSKQRNELSNFTSRQWGMSNDCPSIYRQACFQTRLKPITFEEVLCVLSLACVSVSVLKSIGVWISLRSFQQSWPSKHWRPRVSVKVSRRLLASRQMLTLWHNELNTLSKNTTLRHHSWTIQTECETTVLGLVYPFIQNLCIWLRSVYPHFKTKHIGSQHFFTNISAISCFNRSSLDLIYLAAMARIIDSLRYLTMDLS